MGLTVAQIELPLSAEELTELELWLGRLVTKFGAGLIPPVRVGLTNWLDRVQRDLITAKALAKRKAEDRL